MNTQQYQGGCHCKDVWFVINLEKLVASNDIVACNCSMCEKLGYIHLIIAKHQLLLKTDWKKLSKYQFNSKIAQHFFCKRCGVKSFYQPRSHPDCWSVNIRCLDDCANLDLDFDTFDNFDGKNWRKNIEKIR